MQLIQPKIVRRARIPNTMHIRPNHNHTCSDAEYKAYWATRSIPMPHDKTWLELNGKRKESTADDYCALFDAYLYDSRPINERMSYKEFHVKLSTLGRLP
jgi:hypothetical protein